jgi:hypothetical protein
MSEMHSATGEREPVVDANREWAISRCGHGCVHVALGRLTVTLSDDEFHALQALMRSARERFYPAIGTPGLVRRAH